MKPLSHLNGFPNVYGQRRKMTVYNSDKKADSQMAFNNDKKMLSDV